MAAQSGNRRNLSPDERSGAGGSPKRGRPHPAHESGPMPLAFTSRIAELETDYLVIGAGATGMAFVDTLLANSGHDVILLDRRHAPGGLWLDAYPFVRLHQPSAIYGAESLPMGKDRINTSGPNAGYCERAGATEICACYAWVLHERMLPTGRVGERRGCRSGAGAGSGGHAALDPARGDHHSPVPGSSGLNGMKAG